MSKIISQEVIENFLNGGDPEKYIVSVEYDYKTNKIYKIIQDPEKGKHIKQDTFTPFLWVGNLSGLNFYQNNKSQQKNKMGEHGILIEKLETGGNDRLEKGLTYIVKSIKGYTNLINFFKQGGIDPWNEKVKHLFTILTPVEQYLIQKNKRLFKDIEDYSDVHRFVFDIETTGLDPNVDKIILIGVKDNRNLKETINAFGEDGEKKCIEKFFSLIKEIKPTIISGYNSASFDWPFILKRASILNVDVKGLTQIFTSKGMKEKEGFLKLANEIEPYTQHIIWGFNIIDICHSVRRAQAINSEIKSWGLKYITKYLEKEKTNRVYVDGSKISKIYLENESYYLNPKTGNYKQIGDVGTENLLERYPGKYEIWTGKKIIEQYLDDDLYETMVVDDSFSQSTFLLSKLIPTTYERVSTMGTATLWKIIMLAWSYENKLAIPSKDEKRPITGGLSRLLTVGYSKNIVKFDYASLYPSIQLVYDVFPDCDIMGVQKSMLKYFRNIRIKYKNLAGELKNSDPVASEMYDRKQLPIKIFINAYFGSLSAPQVFPWGDMNMGETITCVGRQFLRMVIMFYMKKQYKPLVMDSVEYDTPVFLKDIEGNLDILPICDLFDENSNYKTDDGLRDFSMKEYEVLTGSGWKNINYVYKHGTNKPIHKLVTKDRLVNCTSDHSVFQNGVQIKPTSLERGSKIDIIDIPVLKSEKTISLNMSKLIGFFVGDGSSYYKNVKRTYSSKKNGLVCYFNKKGEFHLNNSSLEILNEMKKIISEEYGIECTIKDYRTHSGIYRLKTSKVLLCKWFSENCYTSYRQKKIPTDILNGDDEIIKSFMDGFYLADGWGENFNEATDITQKSKVCLSGISYILKRLKIEYKISIRKDKPEITSLILGTHRNGKYYTINDKKSERNSDEIWFNEIQSNKERYVYDISTEDGTFVGGIGGILLKNTDGVNFETPEDVDEHRYIGKGLNELVIKGKEYIGIEADTAEFNDIFMRDEMGLDIDYVAPSCINVSRKNYIIKVLKKGKEKIKLTGNTIKSKKLQQYVVEFLDEGLKHLLNGDGVSFIELYYDYVNKIYNKEIPLSKIANKARVKQSIDDYKEYVKKTTKSGSLMSRQAHMELILLNDYHAGLGETIYYVNNSFKKSDGDVQKVNKLKSGWRKDDLSYYMENNNDNLPDDNMKSMIRVNCYMISEKDILNNPDLKGDYNVPRYLSNFNKRIEPLLVVFKPEIRDEILIEDPKDRQYFTKTQCDLVNGFPLKEDGQDKLDEVMTLSDSEVSFWNRVKRDPFFMYVENSIDLVDKHWIDHNRKVVNLQAKSIKSNSDEIIGTNESDLSFHVIDF
jgi:DNA polymerase elongation subunit (family B)